MSKYPTTIDLVQLLEKPRTRSELGATHYAIRLALGQGLIAPVPERVRHYKLTSKGRARARRAWADR